MFEPKTKVKIASNFATKGAWERGLIGTTGKIAGSDEPLMGVSGKTVRVDTSNGCLFVEPEHLEAV